MRQLVLSVVLGCAMGRLIVHAGYAFSDWEMWAFLGILFAQSVNAGWGSKA